MEKSEIVVSAYNALRANGLIHSQKDFANLLGISEGAMSRALRGDEKYVTDSLIFKVNVLLKEKKASIPASWVQEFPALDGAIQENASETIPVIPTEAVAGTLGDFAESIKEYQCERIISPVKGADYAIKIHGDSMSPEYPSGTMILIKKIDPSVFIPFGNTLVLDTANGAVIKQVFPTENDEVVECRSINPAFPPFKIKKLDVFGWFRVLLSISMK